MNVTKMLEGFVHGELSPLMAGQIGSKAYEQSAKALENMFPDVRGPVVSRPGFVHAANLPSGVDTESCKLFGYQSTPEDSCICAFTADNVTMVSAFQPSHAPDLLANSHFSAGELGWSPVVLGDAVADFDTCGCTLTPGAVAGETITMRQTFTVPDSAGDYMLQLRGLFRGPATTESATVTITDQALGTTGAVTLGSVDLYDDEVYGSIAFNAAGSEVLFLTVVAKDWSGAAINDDRVSYLECLRVEAVKAAIAPVTLVSPYSAQHLAELQAVRVPNSSKLFLLHPDVEPHELIRADSTTWTIAAISLTAMPAEWVAGSYPTALTFHQGRSIWAGIRDTPETFVGSMSGDYEDLTQGTLADQGFSFTLDHVGAIRWVLSAKNLLLGTENGEFKVTSEGGVIMPGDIQVEQQSAHGAGTVLPVKVGTETAFVSVDSRAIRAMAYYWEDDGWVAEDLTYGSEHITKSGIAGLTAGANPNPVLWSVLNNGTLAACSYQYRKGSGSSGSRVTGWHRHHTKWPIESLTVLDDYGTSVPWVALKVTNSSGLSTMQICYLDLVSRLPSYMDASKRITNPGPSTLITGLSHLANQEVDILTDGALHAKQTVSAAGSITLDIPATVVDVGLPYTARITSQPAVLTTKEGLVRHQLGRWSDIFVYVIESALPLIEGSRAAEHEAETRMGYKQPLVTGYTSTTQVGWDRDSTVTVEQDLPFPLTVSHIAGELEK